MTTKSKDEIIAWANEAGIGMYSDGTVEGGIEGLERFATLCRADLVSSLETLTKSMDFAVAANTRLRADVERKEMLIGDGAVLYNTVKAERDALRAEVGRMDALYKAREEEAHNLSEMIIELRAELSALRAGGGEAFMVLEEIGWDFPEGTDPDWVMSLPIGTKTYLHPQPSAVPVVEKLVEALEWEQKWNELQKTRNNLSTTDAIATGQQWLKENT